MSRQNMSELQGYANDAMRNYTEGRRAFTDLFYSDIKDAEGRSVTPADWRRVLSRPEIGGRFHTIENASEAGGRGIASVVIASMLVTTNPATGNNYTVAEILNTEKPETTITDIRRVAQETFDVFSKPAGEVEKASWDYMARLCRNIGELEFTVPGAADYRQIIDNYSNAHILNAFDDIGQMVGALANIGGTGASEAVYQDFCTEVGFDYFGKIRGLSSGFTMHTKQIVNSLASGQLAAELESGIAGPETGRFLVSQIGLTAATKEMGNPIRIAMDLTPEQEHALRINHAAISQLSTGRGDLLAPASNYVIASIENGRPILDYGYLAEHLESRTGNIPGNERRLSAVYGAMDKQMQINEDHLEIKSTPLSRGERVLLRLQKIVDAVFRTDTSKELSERSQNAGERDVLSTLAKRHASAIPAEVEREKQEAVKRAERAEALKAARMARERQEAETARSTKALDEPVPAAAEDTAAETGREEIGVSELQSLAGVKVHETTPVPAERTAAEPTLTAPAAEGMSKS